MSGSTPRLPDDPPDEQRASLGINDEMTIHMSLDDAEHPLLGHHLLAYYSRCRLALLGTDVGCTLILSTRSRTQRAQAVRHPPNAVLVGNQDVSVAPCQPVRRIQSF